MTAPPRPWTALAAKALFCARDRDLDRALKALNAISVRYGDEVIPHVVLAWIDTMMTQCGLAREAEQAVQVLWRHETSDEVTEADETPPGIRWAGRAIAARVADDRRQYMALVNSCASADEWRQNVVGVLDVCSTMLRQHTRGGS
jgi:hypothetical protein